MEDVLLEPIQISNVSEGLVKYGAPPIGLEMDMKWFDARVNWDVIHICLKNTEYNHLLFCFENYASDVKKTIKQLDAPINLQYYEDILSIVWGWVDDYEVQLPSILDKLREENIDQFELIAFDQIIDIEKLYFLEENTSHSEYCNILDGFVEYKEPFKFYYTQGANYGIGDLWLTPFEGMEDDLVKKLEKIRKESGYLPLKLRIKRWYYSLFKR